MNFSESGLSGQVLRGVSACGFTTPTEIQQKTIPPALQGRDIVGCAPTGTGKTAAFVLPILHRLQQPHRSGRIGHFPRALILTPTRELAQQIEDCIRQHGQFTGLRAVSLYGGVDIGRQLRTLGAGTDIVVATPGRLKDHLDRRSIDLSTVEILVIDEADRMYDMGFIQAVRAIIARVPADRQTMLFSATISAEVRSLTAGILKNPQRIEVGQVFSPPDSVNQHFYSVSHQGKAGLLIHILRTLNVESMLVFARTKRGADRIFKRLNDRGFSATAIHSNRSQQQRQRALDGFRRRQFKVLVATDVAARGIDVEGISHVVNFDTPAFAEDYIHRIGRTGRAARTGTALTLVDDEERKYVRSIEYLIGKRFDVQPYPGFASQDLPPAAAPVVQAPVFQSKRRYYRVPRFA